MANPQPGTGRSVSWWMLAALLTTAVAGCAAPHDKVEYARVYPAEITREKQTLNIQVFRRSQRVEFTNTTAREFGPCSIWLNRRFTKPIPGLRVGESLSLPLDDFRDEYSEAFRAGGFFATEAPDTLVQCELEIPGEAGPVMLGLIVVKGDAS